MSEEEKYKNNISSEDVSSTSKILNNLYNKNTEDNIQLGVLLQSIETGGFALLILIFSLMLVIPTPPPVPTIAALIIMFLSAQMIIGLDKVWLPKFITKKEIKRKTLSLIVQKSNIYLYKLESFTRRRFLFINSSIAKRIIGLVIFLLATITLTPIIFANSVPGTAIILISFGMLNKDGLIVIVGFIIGFISIFVVWAMFVYGLAMVIKILKKWF